MSILGKWISKYCCNPDGREDSTALLEVGIVHPIRTQPSALRCVMLTKVIVAWRSNRLGLDQSISMEKIEDIPHKGWGPRRIARIHVRL